MLETLAKDCIQMTFVVAERGNTMSEFGTICVLLGVIIGLLISILRKM